MPESDARSVGGPLGRPAAEQGRVRRPNNRKARNPVLGRFQARSKDQEILEEGGGAGPSSWPRRDHE